MGRSTTKEEFIELTNLARERIPDVAIGTDIIVGFPGEGQEHFQETLEWVSKVRFSSGHVFTYSPRPGTPAARLPGRISNSEMQHRSQILRSLFEDLAEEYRTFFVGKKLKVLWESSQQGSSGLWRLKGLSGNYLRIQTTNQENRWNQIDCVYIQDQNNNFLVGKIL